MQDINKQLNDYLEQHLPTFLKNIQISMIPDETFVDYNAFCKALKVDIIKRITTRYMLKFLNGDYRVTLQKNMIDYLSIENQSEELIEKFTNEGNKYYKHSFKLSNINARIKWKRHTSSVLFPAYDFLHRYTCEPYVTAYTNKNKKVFAYNFNISLDVNTDFSMFFKLLKYYNDTIFKTNLDLNFYLWNRRTNILLIQFLMHNLNPSYSDFLHVHSIRTDLEKCTHERYVKQHKKTLYHFVGTIDFERIRKFPATFHLITQSINSKELFKYKLSHWHLLQKPLWKAVDSLAKAFIQQLDQRINPKNANKLKTNRDILIDDQKLMDFKKLFERENNTNEYQDIMKTCEKCCNNLQPIQAGMLNYRLNKFIKSFGLTKAIAIKDNKNRTSENK